MDATAADTAELEESIAGQMTPDEAAPADPLEDPAAAGEQPADPPAAADELDDPDDDDDQDDELDEPAGRTTGRAGDDADIEKAMVKLQREADRHTRRVGEIMGEDALALVPCELCLTAIPGFRFPVTPDEDVREAVKAAIGLADLTKYLPAPDAGRCETCAGEGRVKTESHVVGQETIVCLSCNGKGWTSASPQRIGQNGQPPSPQIVVDADTPPEQLPDLDPWGTPPDDPEYGKMPQFRTPEGRERITARLAAG